MQLTRHVLCFTRQRMQRVGDFLRIGQARFARLIRPFIMREVPSGLRRVGILARGGGRIAAKGVIESGGQL